MRLDSRFLLVLGCFFASGFDALQYQTAWTRELAFVFGTSELAVVSVLAAYMGGLAVGAAAAARFAPRIHRPVLVYALLELGIALSALGLPSALRGSTALYVALFGGQALPPASGDLAGALYHLSASFALLLVPTALMGATLPLLAGHAVRRDEEIGSRVGALYAANTAGAIAGTVSAGFVLLPSVGLRYTVYVGVAANAAVFFAAAWLARGMAPRAPASASSVGRLSARWMLPLVALSGATSFAYEVLWTRLLSHLLGGSVYAFATMLASFLLGIALGSAVAARLASSPRRAALGFAAAQLGIAVLEVAAFAALDWLPELARATGAGGRGDLGANALVSAAVLLPGALAIGTTFPFAVRLLAREAPQAAAASAQAFAWNTAGAIAGSIGAGFVLLPALGYAAAITSVAAINVALAAAATLLYGFPRLALLPAAAAACALALATPQEPWHLLRTSPLSQRTVRGEITYYGVGRSATVLLIDDGREWTLSTNGLPEARIARPGGIPGRFDVAAWLGLLPVLARPAAERLLVVGLGGGLVLAAAPPTLEAIDVIELEHEVVEANRSLSGLRAIDPLADPRLRVALNDARGALMLTEARWDAIVSQPSHPWTAGASHLYTREFFELARGRLVPDGVFVQWIGLRFVDEALLRMLVATLLDVFPYVEVYQPAPAGVLFAASDAPLSSASAAAALDAAPDHFARLGLNVVEDVAAASVLDSAGARRFAEGAPVNRDRHNLLAARSARLGAEALTPPELERLLADSDPLRAASGDLDALYLVRRLMERKSPERAARLARSLLETAERETALGVIRQARGQTRRAGEHFARALERDPDSLDARLGLLAARERDWLLGDAELEALARTLPPAERAVWAGRRDAARGDWEALRRLESTLAAVQPRSPARRDAERLRARWRAELGGPALGEEALAIVDRLLAVYSNASDLLLRARAARAAERTDVVLASLTELTRVLARAPNRAVARGALTLLDEILPSDSARLVSMLRARLVRASR